MWCSCAALEHSWLPSLGVTRPALLFLLGACGTAPWPVRPLTPRALLRLIAAVRPALRFLALATSALAGEWVFPARFSYSQRAELLLQSKGQRFGSLAAARGADRRALRHRGWCQALPCGSWADTAPSSKRPEEVHDFRCCLVATISCCWLRQLSKQCAAWFGSFFGGIWPAMTPMVGSEVPPAVGSYVAFAGK